MNRIYQAMDIFVFPSLFEGLGIVAIEAQAAGVPIVCSEGLPPETDITPIYRKLMLSDGAEKWAEAAIEMAQSSKAHTNMQKYIIDAGFDMNATAKNRKNIIWKKRLRLGRKTNEFQYSHLGWLEDYYLKRSRK